MRSVLKRGSISLLAGLSFGSGQLNAMEATLSTQKAVELQKIILHAEEASSIEPELKCGGQGVCLKGKRVGLRSGVVVEFQFNESLLVCPSPEQVQILENTLSGFKIVDESLTFTLNCKRFTSYVLEISTWANPPIDYQTTFSLTPALFSFISGKILCLDIIFNDDHTMTLTPVRPKHF